MKVKVGTDGQADDGMKWFRRAEGVSVCGCVCVCAPSLYLLAPR